MIKGSRKFLSELFGYSESAFVVSDFESTFFASSSVGFISSSLLPFIQTQSLKLLKQREHNSWTCLCETVDSACAIAVSVAAVVNHHNLINVAERLRNCLEDGRAGFVNYFIFLD
jgi:hypothetical protein